MRWRHRLLVLTVLTLVAVPAGAATFNVDSSLDEIDALPGDGFCVSTPSAVCTLRAAIIEANQDAAADTVNLPAGLFTLSLAGLGEDAAATGDLDIQAPLTIVGAGMTSTIIDAAGIDRVFEVRPGDADLTLDSLTVRGGSAVTSGSALGAGVFHWGRNLWLTRVRVTGNVANAGAGLVVAYGSVAIVQESMFDDNEALDAGITNPQGPAIRAEGTLSLASSTVTGNTAFAWNLPNVDVSGCSGTLVVHNSTVAGNSVGGGIGIWNCNVVIRHVTVVDHEGYGLRFGSFDGSYSLDVANSVFAGNSVGDCNLGSGPLTVWYSLDSDDTCGLSPLEGSLPATDPQLLPLRDWGGSTETMYPKPWASPVIDVGAGTGICLPYDQRYHDRGNDGDGDGTPGCDMGAVEADDLVFFDDLETGDHGEWSAVVGAAP